MRKLAQLGAGLCGLMLAVVAHAGGVYRWVDDSGQVHFGDFPPQGAEEMQVYNSRPGGSATGGATQPTEPDASLRDPEQCARARSTLKTYEEATLLYRDDPITGRSELTAAERERLLAIQRGQVSRFCDGIAVSQSPQQTLPQREQDSDDDNDDDLFDSGFDDFPDSTSDGAAGGGIPDDVPF